MTYYRKKVDVFPRGYGCIEDAILVQYRKSNKLDQLLFYKR